MSERPAVLITGAAHRVGRYLALAFARRGWRIGLHYNRSHEAAQETAAEIDRLGGEALLMPADLANEVAVDDLAGQASAMGNWQALVNSAAIFERDRTDTATRASWDAHQAVNLRAPFHLTQRFAEQADKARDNLVINILDSKVLRPNEHYLSYSTAKAGLWYLTQAQALDLAPAIRVNAIGPGPVLVAPGQSEENFERMVSTLPLARAPSEEEFDAAVGFLLAARSVTGQLLALDGGAHLGWQPPARAR
jgi:NAD(P)-dependent dehydrogenase (short-subunit alcohol dehydrogenase family)